MTDALLLEVGDLVRHRDTCEQFVVIGARWDDMLGCWDYRLATPGFDSTLLRYLETSLIKNEDHDGCCKHDF